MSGRSLIALLTLLSVMLLVPATAIGQVRPYQILQTPGYVAIVVEMIHDARIIPLDGRPHLNSGISQWLGDSRGRWEGDALVVETTNFTNKTTVRGSGERLRLVERFTRTAADRLEWSVTVDDRATWTKPWTFAMPLVMNDREPIFEFACHEGNYAVPNILSAARLEEKR